MGWYKTWTPDWTDELTDIWTPDKAINDNHDTYDMLCIHSPCNHAPPVGSWLVNVSVSELMNIHRAGRCSRSGGKFKRSCLRRVACSRSAMSRSVTIVQQPPSSARPGSFVAMACLITMNNLHMALV